MVANLTAIAGTAATYFTLYPSNVTRPRASDLNPAPGETIANLSIVGIAQTAPSLSDVSLDNNAGRINAILDVAGWFQYRDPRHFRSLPSAGAYGQGGGSTTATPSAR